MLQSKLRKISICCVVLKISISKINFYNPRVFAEPRSRNLSHLSRHLTKIAYFEDNVYLRPHW